MATVEVQSIPYRQLPLSKDRIVPGSTNVPIGRFPQTTSLSSIDAAAVASQLISDFNTALSRTDYDAVAALFLETGYWRDHLCVTWELRTLKGREKIAHVLKTQCNVSQLAVDDSTPFRAPHVGPIDAFGEVIGVEFFVSVTSKAGNGRGVVRLAEENGQWRFLSLFTSLHEITGHEERTYHRRPRGDERGGHPASTNWLDRRKMDREYKDKSPAVLILGAGQAGLTAAARLKALNIDTLLVDQVDRVGDSWRKRYHTLVLHDPIWYDHLPYIPFPSTWPVFAPKDKIADFFESYASLLELNVWTRTTIVSSAYDETTKRWTVTLARRREDGSSETRTLHPHHIIQATGHSGEKNMPTFKGQDSFRGDRLVHSSEFTGARHISPEKKKKAVVVGSCNSGHDIAQDFYEHGYDVTMVQRSSTCVVTGKFITEIGMKALYGEDGPPTEDADVYLWGIPTELYKAQQLKVSGVQAQHDAEILHRLEEAGFKVDSGPDDAGLMFKYLQRGGGYYIDVGASQLIADGKIKVKHGQEIEAITPTGLLFADGSTLEADEIVCATGYQNMRTQSRLIFGDAVADRVGDVWGFDEEGEMRSIWRKSGHPGFWFMGGNLALCRYYSRILALQIAAVEAGLTPA
ncbi:hypothetical protein ASPZODRAFT_65690 [Penicilliopsis zonata CBS 506.65]|uniref:FAD/NAD(P)-binding domain-containing protein n=1 Tax=Penicilliopsis zonata CBS 506.65 TaxID=1073090 RepID=A0A1L9SI92_9EURO|nr:hypothetical protein ASPZODRAFT_65690 [Penicilliopsis zonata CBS 506.65]OJJ46857.1 hypothetical protein ASPZODRAFT_65690 [Penicilliopsis zonata CBS 506.65]